MFHKCPLLPLCFSECYRFSTLPKTDAQNGRIGVDVFIGMSNVVLMLKNILCYCILEASLVQSYAEHSIGR